MVTAQHRAFASLPWDQIFTAIVTWQANQILPKSSVPIKEFAPAVFSQATQHEVISYSSEELEALKRKVQNLKPKDWDGLFSKIALEPVLPSQNKAVHAIERINWIYTLLFLERRVLANASQPSIGSLVTVDVIQTINRCLTHKLTDNPGSFREGPEFWLIKTYFTLAESGFLSIVDDYLEKKDPNFTKELLKPKGKRKEFLVSIQDAINLFPKDEVKLVGISQEEGQLRIQKGELLLRTQATLWAKEQKRKDGKIELLQWLEDRRHQFPFPEEIQGELSQAVEKLKDLKVHPALRAAEIWFDIVRIHPFESAHKRTGRVVAFLFLQLQGFNPPGAISTAKERGVFKEALMRSVALGKRGFPIFANYLVPRILEANR